MSLRFFADHCVPNSAVQILQEAGHKVLRLRDHITPDSSDQLAISKAQELDAILLSLKGDFADIATYPPARYKGIVALGSAMRHNFEPPILAKSIRFAPSIRMSASRSVGFHFRHANEVFWRVVAPFVNETIPG